MPLITMVSSVVRFPTVKLFLLFRCYTVVNALRPLEPFLQGSVSLNRWISAGFASFCTYISPFLLLGLMGICFFFHLY